MRRKGARDPRMVRAQRPAVHSDSSAALSHGSRHRPRDRDRPAGLWLSHPLGKYLPLDPELLDWLFGADIRDGLVTSPFDIRDVWPSSYSGNTNEILWGAKVGARLPWVTCVIRLTSYECGMDQPTFTPVQQIVEHSGTLFFSFQDLDSTKPAGSVKIRVETIAYYLERASKGIIAGKKAQMPGPFPFCGPGRDRGEKEASVLGRHDAKAGDHHTYMSRLERGLENPTVAVLDRIAKALNADIVESFVSRILRGLPSRSAKCRPECLEMDPTASWKLRQARAARPADWK